jgi:orotate phosphoribosyltransferase
MDRMERGGSDDNLTPRSAVEEFQRAYGLPVVSIATLTDLLRYLRSNDDAALRSHFERVATYRERYGVS